MGMIKKIIYYFRRIESIAVNSDIRNIIARILVNECFIVLATFKWAKQTEWGNQYEKGQRSSVD